MVFYTITPSSQRIIPEIQDLESCMKVLNEAADQKRALIVSKSHRVDG